MLRRSPLPAVDSPVLLLLLGLLVGLGQPVIAADTAQQNSTPHSVALEQAYAFHGIAEYSPLEEGKVRVRVRGNNDASFVLPFVRRVENEKLELRFRRLKNVRNVGIYLGVAGKPFLQTRGTVLNTAVPGRRSSMPVYHVRLPDGEYDRLRIVIDGRAEGAEAVLESITTLPLEVWDHSVWVYAVALGLAVLLLLPGALLYVVLHGSRWSSAGFQISLFPYSLVFYLAHYLFLAGALQVTSEYAHTAVVLGFVGALTALVALVRRKADRPRCAELLRASWQQFTAFTSLLLLLCFVLIHDANLPLENLFYTDISGPKTFDAFRAHDNIFQYVNGIAIANNEPFDRYYGNNQLIYRVEDREILPGVVYAVFRALLSPLKATLAESYLAYTLIGVAMNLMIVFPAAVIAKRYLRIDSTLPFVLLFSANAFMLGNYLITWFKLAAAALFLSGLYSMLEERAAQRRWVTSGLFFGLAANMHAGSALGLPLFVLWGTLRHVRDAGGIALRSVAGPAVLVVVFAAVVAPWMIVKRVYLEDNQTLIKTHFLSGYSSPEGLGASARLFLEHVSLPQQIPQRLGQLKDAVRATEVEELYRDFTERGFKPFLKRWNQLEFNYLSILLYPAILFATFGWLYRAVRPVDVRGNKIRGAHTVRTMLVLSFLTMAILILVHYGRHAPDITYHQPLGVLALAHIVLIGSAWDSNRFIRAAYVVYGALAVYRLALFA